MIMLVWERVGMDVSSRMKSRVMSEQALGGVSQMAAEEAAEPFREKNRYF
jgi:hypothetical protein